MWTAWKLAAWALAPNDMIKRLIFCLVLLFSSAALAKPFIPASEDTVLEYLTYSSAEAAELRQLRNVLTQQPHNLELATDLAWRYLHTARATGEPRYYGYLQAALAPWWSQSRAPAQVLLLRATVRQNQHEFAAALADLARLLVLQPRNQQAWLTQAIVLTVQGHYPEALQSCLPLRRLASTLLFATCYYHVLSHNGQAEASYAALEGIVSRSSSHSEERHWALAVLAEIAMRLGYVEDADKYFQETLAQLNQRKDIYLLSRYADFLLDQQQPQRVIKLLGDETQSTDLLLRLVIAERQLNHPEFATHKALLNDHLQTMQRRGDDKHLALRAKALLNVFDKPERALSLALRNWQTQREPSDAQLVLQAALSAQDYDRAKPVLEWLVQAKLEDITITRLTQQLQELE